MNHGPFNGDLDRVLQPTACNRQVQSGAGFAAHPTNGLIQGHPFDGRTIKTHDQVAGKNAGTSRWRAIDWCHHFDQAVVIYGHFNAQTAEFTPGIDIDFPVSLRI